MLANLVRIALAAELVAWGALWWGWAGLGAGPAALATLAGVALVRLVLVLATFALSNAARSPRGPGERLGAGAMAALVLGEWGAMLSNNLWALPFEHAALRADPGAATAPGLPVIVVHGYFSNRGTVRAMARALDTLGTGPVHVPTLPAVTDSIEAFAAHLVRAIEAVVEATGQPRVILVCHSMGGLVARVYLRERGPERVALLVTLGSPHHGSVLARLGVGRNARQMRPGSDFLAGLARAEGGAGPGCGFVSVYTVHDNLVAPQETSVLAGRPAVRLAGVGHLAMLADPRVHRAVAGAIAAAR